MAAQYQREDLLKAGKEGFAILDNMYGRGAKISPPPTPTPTPTPHFHHHHHHQYEYYDQQQSYYVYRGPQVVTVIREPVIDSNQAARLYGGTVIREPIIDSNQAARLYGGTVTIEYSKRKPAGWAAF